MGNQHKAHCPETGFHRIAGESGEIVDHIRRIAIQSSTEGGEELSNRRIKAALKELLDHEDKSAPLSDDALSKMLKEQGLAVARRTVAKYREQMGVPSTRLRR